MRSGAFLGFVSSAGFFLATGISGVLTARALDPAGKGTIALALSWAGVLLQLGSFGISHVFAIKVSQSVNSDPSDTVTVARKLWYDGFVLALLMGGTMLILGLLVSVTAVKSASAQSAVRLIALESIPMLIAANQFGLLRGLQRFRSYAIAFASQPVIWLILVTGLYLMDRITVRSALMSHVASLLVAVFLGHIMVRRRLGSFIGGRWQDSFRHLRDSWLYGLSGLAIFGNARLDQLLLGAIALTSVLGVYSVAVSYAALLSPISAGFALVSLPRVAATDNYKDGRRIIESNLKAFILLATPLSILMWAIASKAIPALFGPQYRDSVDLIGLLLLAQLVLGGNHILHEGIRGLGLVSRSTAAEVLAFAAGFPICIVSIQQWGIMGAALASLATYVIAAVALSYSVLFSEKSYGGTASPSVTERDPSIEERAWGSAVD